MTELRLTSADWLYVPGDKGRHSQEIGGIQDVAGISQSAHRLRRPLDTPPGLPDQERLYARALRGSVLVVQFLFGVTGAAALMVQLPKLGPLINCNVLSKFGAALEQIFTSLVYDSLSYFHLELGQDVRIALVALIMISIARSAVNRQIDFFRSDRELDIGERLPEYFSEGTLKGANPRIFKIAAELINAVHELFLFPGRESRFERSIRDKAIGEAMVATGELFVRNAPRGADEELLRFVKGELAIEFPWRARLLFRLKQALSFVSITVVFLPIFDFMLQVESAVGR